ncbi:hypothetical protein S2M10_18000 [Sphingomonas sp. S2M10]|jgi:hypothetical protein|uniref:hypothetical protein n=1 Tax=Sphingomonas sp. S2M10 TaxID=2705010 RepID=UPI001456F236|nr:hypothetical protein [Sphingomonas sp. S2M10]NLS26813.1 hypothetical protein [Sphingomonas sp. S2M10]
MKSSLKQSPGDIFAFDGIEYIFERRDPDGKLTYRHIYTGFEYTITDIETGYPCKPTDEDIVRLMAEGKVVQCAEDLEERPRRAGRKRHLNGAAARAANPRFEFRTICRGNALLENAVALGCIGIELDDRITDDTEVTPLLPVAHRNQIRL